MSGKDFEVDSNFLIKKKCDRGGVVGIDTISQLPDEIITHILSLLPLREAVATSILSPRWSNSWKYIPNLNFVNNRYFDPIINIPIDDMPIEEPINRVLVRSLKNIEWVNSVLNSYKALSLKQLTISFYMHRSTSFHHVNKWLHFAFSRRVETFELDLQNAPFVLDVNILSGIQSSDYRFLRELTLKNFEVTGEAIEFLLRSCSVLEGLIMGANLTSDLVVSGTLKYLEICPSSNGGIIKVSAPNLTRLLKISFDNEMLLLENVPNLVDLSFDLFGGKDTMLHFAKAAATLEILTVTLINPEVFPVPRMPKLKKLVLDYHLVTKKYLLPVTCLLQASPCLEEFKLEISDLWKYYYGRVSSICKAIFEVPKVVGFPHYHLKIFEFSGFCDRGGDHVELVRYIANNCVALEEITITPISIILACQYKLRHGTEREKRYELSRQVESEEEQDALDMKKSAENVLAGQIPDHIKLLVN